MISISKIPAQVANSALQRRSLLQLLPLTVLGSVIWRPVAAAPSADDARTLVETSGAKVLDILRNPGFSRGEKFKHLVDVLTHSIDVQLVGRLILGRYWRSADRQQRAEYLKLFHAYALANLASRLHLYNGQTFEVNGAQVADDKDALVTSRILSNDRPPLQVVWRVREVNGAKPAVIDMVIEGVSLIITQRAEFAAVIERSGMDGLLAELRQRIDKAA